MIWDTLRDLVPFTQLKKREKHPCAGFSKKLVKNHKSAIYGDESLLTKGPKICSKCK